MIGAKTILKTSAIVKKTNVIKTEANTSTAAEAEAGICNAVNNKVCVPNVIPELQFPGYLLAYYLKAF